MSFTAKRDANPTLDYPQSNAKMSVSGIVAEKGSTRFAGDHHGRQPGRDYNYHDELPPNQTKFREYSANGLPFECSVSVIHCGSVRRWIARPPRSASLPIRTWTTPEAIQKCLSVALLRKRVAQLLRPSRSATRARTF